MARQDTVNHTPVRTFRIDDQLWRQALAKASDAGTTVSDVIRAALERYVR